ncbi:hypothetical protein BN1080_02068 [Planococcus massiliensis]|uniref:Uncharacterized protein n=1 Tax=Planococcus massiliensis TaxID=1499687 RepID=A0A098ELD3_9BACL|nr:hypothetical protein [Planococcus massiliensis]CEG23124.1 hypothetical protein BN1080_02068 [Planococcus massiliensis]
MKIQGITIALGADASGIETALSDVNKASGKTSKELQQINKALKFDPDNVNLLQQRFDVLQDAARNAAAKLDTLRQAQAEVDRQFAAGEIDDSQFRAFNREIEMTEGLLRNLQNQARQTDLRINPTVDTSDLQNAEQDIEDLGDAAEQAGDRITQALAGAVAGIGLAGIAENGLAESDLQAKINITFDVPEDSKQSVREALAEVQAYGVDGEEALEGLRKQWALNKDASDESNRSIVNSAAAIASVYGDIDFKELIQETNEIGKELEVSDEEALNLVNSLLRIGFPPDQLDIIAEYGGQLRRAGYEAKQIQGIMAAAVGTGSWNIDNLLDGLKEGRIRATEMGEGLSEAMKDSLRKVMGPVKKMSDEQLQAMEEGLEKQEGALSKSLDAQYESTEKGFEKQVEAMSDSMDEQYEAAVDSYDRQRDALEDSLADELKSFEKAATQRIKLIDKEYMEKMKLIDEDRYNKLKAIDDEINGLRALTEAENKAAKDRENAEKRAELNADIANQRTKKGRRLATEKLNEFEAKLRADQVQEERDAEIESLKIRKDGINEAADEKKEALKSEYDLLKERATQEIEVGKETLKERQSLELEAFDKRKKASLENLQEINSRELDALKERQEAQLSLMQEANAKELEAFQKMNDEKMELAKNPPDSAAFVAMEKQLVAWGKAIASGTDPKAFEEMTKWLNGIEDATLRNTLGVGIFGTIWEDQGENIVESILGADEALVKLSESEQKAKDVADSMDASALKKMNEAIQSMMVELAPLLTFIAGIIGKFAEFVVANPAISAAFLAIAVIIGTLAAAFIALGPAIAAIPAILPILTGAFAALSGVFATVTAALPAIGAAIAAIAAPVAIAIAAVLALIGIVALIVKNWEPIKEFFSNLWANIVEIFINTKDAIFEVVGNWISGIKTRFTEMKDGAIGIFESLSTAAGVVWRAMKEVLMKPVNSIKDAITGVFETISDTLTGIWDGITNKIKDSINFIIELINDFIGGMNTLKIPDWVPAIGGAGVDIPSIPMLAKGTEYFKGGPAIVGERGPELVDMPRGARVTSNDKLAGMGGTTITGNNFIIREEADVKRVARELHNLAQVEMRGR